MKSLLTAALLSVALTGSAFAYSANQSHTTPPPRVVPSSVVKPTNLPQNFAGAVINVEFSLDAAGQPQNVKVLWVDDAALKKQLVAAFRQWRFENASQDDARNGKRYLLPIQLRPEA